MVSGYKNGGFATDYFSLLFDCTHRVMMKKKMIKKKRCEDFIFE